MSTNFAINAIITQLYETTHTRSCGFVSFFLTAIADDKNSRKDCWWIVDHLKVLMLECSWLLHAFTNWTRNCILYWLPTNSATQLEASKSWVNQMSPYVLKIGGWLLLFFPSSDILTTTKHRDPPNINRFWSAVSALSSHQWGKFVWVFSCQVQWPQHSSPGWSLPAQVQSCLT